MSDTEISSQNIRIDEEAILLRAKAGNLEAMDVLIIRYQDRIYNTILKICSNPEDASELTQDTFVKAIEQLHNFEFRSSFYTWIFRIAVNLTLNFCKRRFRIRFEPIEGSRSDDAGDCRGKLREYLTGGQQADPSKLVCDSEIHNILLRAIANLDDDQRTAIVLRDIEGMRYDRIADVLGVELGTVKSRISRARENLRQQLDILTR